MKVAFFYGAFLILFTATPGYAQEREFPYKLNKRDYLLAPLSIGTYMASNVLEDKKDHNLTLDQIRALDRNDVNGFDRPATYYWNRSADKVSNTLFHTLPFTPLILVIPQLKNKNITNAATLGVMYVEVLLLTKGLTGITKSLTGRTRPYLYNTSFTPEERFYLQDDDDAPVASTSFFSGHASGTFAFAVLLSKTYTDIYGKGTWSKVIWATSLSLASATAACRVAAGEHYATDVIVGALVGSTIGYGIPVLHKVAPEKLSLNVLPNYFAVTYRF